MKDICLYSRVAIAVALTFASTAQAAEPTATALPTPSTGASGCEVHVFPTRNFMAMNSGLLSGFGAVGAVVDVAAHADRVKTVKEVMADILTPEAQMEQLHKVDFVKVLKLPADTAVILETPMPNAGEIKADPAAKARSKSLQADEKAGKRLTASAARCYTELAASYVFYQKAAMYGTRVFTFFTYRDFRNGQAAPGTSRGMVETHTPEFPASAPGKEEEAKAALLHTYGADFLKWADLKLKTS